MGLVLVHWVTSLLGLLMLHVWSNSFSAPEYCSIWLYTRETHNDYSRGPRTSAINVLRVTRLSATTLPHLSHTITLTLSHTVTHWSYYGYTSDTVRSVLTWTTQTTGAGVFSGLSDDISWRCSVLHSCTSDTSWMVILDTPSVRRRMSFDRRRTVTWRTVQCTSGPGAGRPTYLAGRTTSTEFIIRAWRHAVRWRTASRVQLFT